MHALHYQAVAHPSRNAWPGTDTPHSDAAPAVSQEFLKLLLSANANLGIRDAVGMTAIMHAAQAGHAASVRVLLEAGGDPNELCDNGSACLEYAQWRVEGDSPKHLEVIKLLLEDKLLPPDTPRQFQFEPVDINQLDWCAS